MAATSWTKLDASQYMVWRPFYFANLIVDPKNDNKLFKPDVPVAAQREWRDELQLGGQCARRFS